MNTRKILFAFLITLFCLNAHAQQYAVVGSFTNTLLYYNPAYAGAGDGLRFSVLSRTQWRGVPGAPSTQMVNIDGPIGNNIGLGLAVSADKISFLGQYDAMANASYRLYLSSESYLQLGLRLGASFITVNQSSIFQWDENDPVLTAYGNGVIPRVGFGAYYRHPLFYVGLSAPDLVSMDTKKIYFDEVTKKSSIRRNYFMVAGTRANISEYIALVPAALVRYYPGKSMQFTINLGVEFNQTVTAGVTYSYPDIYGAYGMVGLTPKIRIGYRYEKSPNAFRSGQLGTNEFMLTYGIN